MAKHSNLAIPETEANIANLDWTAAYATPS
jgi:hypothetical protein